MLFILILFMVPAAVVGFGVLISAGIVLSVEVGLALSSVLWPAVRRARRLIAGFMVAVALAAITTQIIIECGWWTWPFCS